MVTNRKRDHADEVRRAIRHLLLKTNSIENMTSNLVNVDPQQFGPQLFLNSLRKKHSRTSPDVQFREFSLTKQKTRPRTDHEWIGKTI